MNGNEWKEKGLGLMSCGSGSLVIDKLCDRAQNPEVATGWAPHGPDGAEFAQRSALEN